MAGRSVRHGPHDAEDFAETRQQLGGRALIRLPRATARVEDRSIRRRPPVTSATNQARDLRPNVHENSDQTFTAMATKRPCDERPNVRTVRECADDDRNPFSDRPHSAAPCPAHRSTGHPPHPRLSRPPPPPVRPCPHGRPVPSLLIL